MGDAVSPPKGVEWDPRKADSNARNHGVTFQEAAVALTHQQAYTKPTPQIKGGEVRELTFAPGADDRLLAVAHTRRGNNVRIISARRASRRERSRYAEATGTPAR
ncbi:MAG: BrnT family toxin [Chloroflexota bacterium]|nr:BrnT family toxin [Chloroflexota bacterium]